MGFLVLAKDLNFGSLTPKHLPTHTKTHRKEREEEKRKKDFNFRIIMKTLETVKTGSNTNILKKAHMHTYLVTLRLNHYLHT